MSTILRPFHFGQIQDTRDFMREMRAGGVELPCSDDLKILERPIQLGRSAAPNRIAIHPLEGFDATIEGKPSPRIFRRYTRYAEGGAGLIWFEACAVCVDGICNPYQLVLVDENLSEMKQLVACANSAALNARGAKPYNVLQLTHSGRGSVDHEWNPIPLTAFANPLIDRHYRNLSVASDERLELLERQVIRASVLAAEAGFDAVDIKLCHNYIMRELLAAFTRPGKYGGSFENRTRFLFNVIDGIRAQCGDALDICARLNAYDCLPYPYGWGMVQAEGALGYDLSEPIRLMKMLKQRGVKLLNISTMMPRFSPLDTGYLDSYEGKAVLNPYQATATLLGATRELKQAVPGSILVATGLSWFRQFGANVGAGGIEQGWFDIAGFGRQGFAYPQFASDILDHGRMERSKCCVNCDKCYDLIHMHENSGCVVRDAGEYLPLYKRGLERQKGGAPK